MLTDDLDASSAAIEVGYERVSQFNREYSRLFGQPPMRECPCSSLVRHVAGFDQELEITFADILRKHCENG